jgi:hypothetical protein
MDERKMNIASACVADLRAEMIAFVERERRSLGNLAVILLEWSFEQLKAARSTTRFRRKEALESEVTTSPM